MNLFTSNEISEQTAIFLVDASASVKSCFSGSQTVFSKMREICAAKVDTFRGARLIFWNTDKDILNLSDQSESDFHLFKNGIFRPSQPISNHGANQLFTLVESAIDRSCITCPHLGFEAIDDDWISDVLPTHIYYLTDGQIGYNQIKPHHLEVLKSRLQASIEKLFARHNHIHLHLITVEARHHDFGVNHELLMATAAGGDVFDTFQRNKLTKYMTEFIAYTLNQPDGYVQMSTVRPPAGFAPYGEVYFSTRDADKFFAYLYDHVKSERNNEQALLRCIQHLATTVSHLATDKPSNMLDMFVHSFGAIFADTCIDTCIVEALLGDTVRRERDGKRVLLSEYRSRLRQLFEETDRMLINDARNAMGMMNEFISAPPSRGMIVCGHRDMVRHQFGKYSNGALRITNSHVLPVMPLVEQMSDLSPMRRQAIRQYMRQIVSTLHDVDAKDDVIMFIVLAETLRVVSQRHIAEKYKTAYRHLSIIMLEKKCMLGVSGETTELERLAAGHLPTCLGKTFDQVMQQVTSIVPVSAQVSPLTVWYAMCLALGDERLINKQLIHCQAAIHSDVPTLDRNSYKKLLDVLEWHKPIQVCILPIESTLDYKCFITMKETHTVGGYRILAHRSLTGARCAPNYVLSNEGYYSMWDHASQSGKQLSCPICYVTLSAGDFANVGPYVEFDGRELIEAARPFNNWRSDCIEPARKKQREATLVSALSTMSFTTNSSNNNNNKNNNVVIVMKGTVGSGKSTFSEAIRKHVVGQLGGQCCVVGTDKYCKNGMSTFSACRMVTNELTSFKQSARGQLSVIIVDTCGERSTTSSKSFFEVDFSSWRIVDFYPNLERSRLNGYFHWSLRNVLSRAKPGPNSNFYLNPSAGVSLCQMVHHRKSTALFGASYRQPTCNPHLAAAINELRPIADEYATFLASDPNMRFENQLKRLIDEISS